MQVFLPYPNFLQTAQTLDQSRLGKQRVECLQLINALMRGDGAWYNHPAAVMFRNHIPALALYSKVICEEWIRQGFRDTVLEQIEPYLQPDPRMPSWLGDERLHASHRSNLLRKYPNYYGYYGWTEPNDLPYFWPGESL